MHRNLYRSLISIGVLVQTFLPYDLASQIVNRKPKLVYNSPQDTNVPKIPVTAGGDNFNLIAVMPGTRSSLDHVPRSLSTHPTFFFYINFNTENTSVRGRFILYKPMGRDRSDIIYKTNFIINNGSGFIRFTLPPNAPDLEINELYHWKMYASVNSIEILKGFIKRVEASAELEEQIKQAPSSELAIIYAKAGIWFEAVKALADQKYRDPKNQEINSQWLDLFSFTRLKSFADRPIIECCDVQK